MAHFAELDENNFVIRVIVVNDNDCGGGIFPESCPIGSDKLTQFFGGRWKQTSYNNNFRNQFAGIGGRYILEKDKFISPQPYPSWSLNENFDWVAPVEHPNDDKMYYWSEATQSWVQ